MCLEKRCVTGVFISIVILFLLTACNNSILNEKELSHFEKTSERKSEVACQIEKFKNTGLLDKLLSSTRSSNNEEDEAILEFINNTDEVLKKIKTSENGEAQLALIDTLFTGSDVNEFVKSLYEIDADKAEEFLEYVNDYYETQESCSSRSQSTNNPKLLYYTDIDSNRGIYSADLEWRTILWYTGFCLSTAAGFVAMSCGGIWVKAAGAIAAVAGTYSMVKQLVIWCNCSELDNFISSLIDKNGDIATKILNTENGKKILTIVVETVATITVSYLTTAGRKLVHEVVLYYNKLVDIILGILPKGINYIFNGIALVRIPL